jgi:hypothetical protein
LYALCPKKGNLRIGFGFIYIWMSNLANLTSSSIIGSYCGLKFTHNKLLETLLRLPGSLL